MAADGRVPYVTPLVRNRAAELGVDVATLTGTGVGGRIRVKDVETAAARTEDRTEPPKKNRVQAESSLYVQVTGSSSVRNVAEHVHQPADVVIGQDVDTDTDVYLCYEDRDRGVSIIGKSGTGKSSLLEHLVLSDLEHGIPGMVIDPHGRLAERIVRLAPPMGADNIVLLEVNEEQPFGLNLLDVDRSKRDYVTLAADSVIEAVKKLYGETEIFQPRLENYLDLAVRVVIKNNGTLVDVPRLFDDKAFRPACLKNVTDSKVLRKFEEYETLRPGERRNEVESVFNRLDRVCRSDAFDQILGSRTTTVPFDEILNGETMLIVSLPAEQLSEERCNFMGSLLLCALNQRIKSRGVSSAKPPRLHLYLDEYQRFASRVTHDLLTQGRKYGAGITIAHQDIFSITDPVVRNASRHAGTMVLLGLTRPDAEELSGEFPIKPRPECVKTVEDIDGTEPVHVLSPTPAEDIYLEPHPDPEVDLAARSLLTADLRTTSVTEKSAGVHPRPGGLKVDHRVKVHATAAQTFLFQAMTGELPTNKLFADALIENLIPVGFELYYPKAVFFWLRNESPNTLDGTTHRPNCRFGRVGHEHIIADCGCHEGRPAKEVIAHRQKLRQIFEACASDQLERIRAWILTYLDDRDALRVDKRTRAFQEADTTLLIHSKMHRWDGLWDWIDPLRKTSAGEFEPTILIFAFAGLDDREYQALDILRQRLRWLLILAEGLERSPLWVASGVHQPRPTKRHIVHSAQTEQDALNEFAAKLVTPPARYVAQIKSPHGYFETQMRDALEGDGDWTQLLDVREHSRGLYSVTLEEPDEAQAPTRQPASVSPRPPQVQRRAAFPGAPPGHVQPDTEVSEEPAMPQMSVPVSHPVVETGWQSGSRETEFPEEFIAATASEEQLLTSVEPHDAGALVIKPADVVVEAEVLFDAVVDATVAEVLVAPPAGLCLGNYLPAHVFSEKMGGYSFEMLRTYVWTDQESFERAARWLQAGLAEGRAKSYEGEFLGQALGDLYHHDRSTRASQDNGKLAPIHVDEIPQYRNKFTGRSYVQQLNRRGQELSRIGWKGRVPAAVTDAITHFIGISPYYEAIGQVEYRWRRSSVRAVVVYATFGQWAVEVCDWSP